MGRISSGEATTGWTSSRADRLVVSRCGMCDAAQGVECRPGFIHTGRRFELGLCWPGVRLGGGSAPMLEGACVATVDTNYLWDFSRPGRDDVATRDAIVYRGACLGCGWA